MRGRIRQSMEPYIVLDWIAFFFCTLVSHHQLSPQVQKDTMIVPEEEMIEVEELTEPQLLG